MALDLKNDPALIAEYEAYHLAVWPEIRQSILDSGIRCMEIFRVENRLFMIMETAPEFSFEKKQAADAQNARVQEWETLMWNYQQALPTAKPGEKWVLMQSIFRI
ncbi:L-rhamnose mutarotase [Niabella hirudinis]|uniref:L-rhamnose mutarotase n=1 Tax=Niabella hirudinis TaxID=1285929 RepID=UPI003EB71E6D